GRPEGIAAIRLPSNKALPISSDPGTLLLDGLDGELCADLICISGWRPPETWGVWADAPAAILRFRADVPAGHRIHVVVRLIGADGDRRHIRISCGSGAQTEVVLMGTTDRVAAVSCEVEPGDLVSLRISLIGAHHEIRERYWGLKGILYYPSGRAARE